MKQVLFVLAALSFAACQQDNNAESSLAAASASNNAFQVVTTPARSLGAGRYVVTVETTGSCHDGVSNLKQTYEFPNSNPEKTPTVTLETDGNETDNMMRTRECRLGTKDVGQTIVTLDKEGKVRAKGYAAKITKIEKIEKTSSVAMKHLGDLFAGDYVLSVSRPGICAPGTFTSKKHTEFGDSSRKLELSSGSSIVDNLIRPAVCVAASFDTHLDSGSVYHVSAGGKMEIIGKDMKIRKIERITKKSSI